MSSLLTAATILGNGAEGLPEKSARFVTIIHGDAEKLSEIVDSVVEASVLGSTQQRPETTSVPAGELFRRAIAPIRDLATQRQVKLQVLIPNDLDVVSCDPRTMEVALRAILKNAIEFNHRGGEAKVEDQDERIHIALDNPDELALKAGDLVKVTVLLERSEEALYLPPAAVRTFEGRKFVMVKAGDRLQKVDVKIGIEGEDRWEILSGLEEGQVIEGL